MTPSALLGCAALLAISSSVVSEAGAAAGPQSAGCGVTGKPTGDLKLVVKDGAGVARNFEVLVPSSYVSTIPLALSFVYHDAGGAAADAKALGLQNAPGAAAASIFVFPQGVQYQSHGVGWDDTCGGYDMPFFDNMLATLEASYCIDTRRVFVAGFSWGCDQVTALACCRGDRILGVAAASCSDEFADPANYRTYRNLTCPTSSAPAIRFTHETQGDSGYPAPLFATTLGLYRSFNHCSDAATSTSPNPCRSYQGCAHPLVDCPYSGLGHAVPQGWGNDTWTYFSTLAPAAATPAPVPSIPRPLLVFACAVLLGAGLLAPRRGRRAPH